jgi:protein involved in polysaccharide export with SLBB domain
MTKNDFSQNVKLQPGDVIFIPTSNSPDLQQVNSLLNTAFILNTFGSLFGLRLIR